MSRALTQSDGCGEVFATNRDACPILEKTAEHAPIQITLVTGSYHTMTSTCYSQRQGPTTRACDVRGNVRRLSLCWEQSESGQEVRQHRWYQTLLDRAGNVGLGSVYVPRQMPNSVQQTLF
jgi:hypothetical protein